ncbi:Rho-binding antiterminator [Pseudomonas sp. Lb2C1-1]|uniref:Transcriptional antiterminator n=1 Tax=Pseudomonas ogarae (strain DSM 112162 / CECT 30235 / F113) TaxID=1114970 RepID=A0ABM6QWS5_PSEO1|nr:Rho-binding antiterminator [Pseudomonas ogarae]AEV61017.1 YaeO [Pseudomonas ogarae]AUO44892.1 transcriptional antiterminator [Pseudomonas ogarae]
MSTYKPLHCDLHDYLEIACLCGYTLDIELTNGQRLTARAITTRTASTREEFLEVETTDGRLEIRLDQLLAITPLDNNARFGRVVLTVGDPIGH